MNDVLSALFGSSARVKILRLFLSNASTCYAPVDVSRRTKVHIQTTRKELRMMEKIGLLEKKNCVQLVTRGRGAQKKEVEKKVPGFVVNQQFEHFSALRSFILNIAPTDDKGVAKKVSGAGRVKLLLTSGVFIQDADSRVDILVVADSMNDSRLRSAIRDLEAHMGRELRYAAFSTDDFTYRLGAYDRLIRDVLDYPHQIIIDKLPPHWRDITMRKGSVVQ